MSRSLGGHGTERKRRTQGSVVVNTSLLALIGGLVFAGCYFGLPNHLDLTPQTRNLIAGGVAAGSVLLIMAAAFLRARLISNTLAKRLEREHFDRPDVGDGD